jgi:hypothetical protein
VRVVAEIALTLPIKFATTIYIREMIIFPCELCNFDFEFGQLRAEQRRSGAPADSYGPIQTVSHAEICRDLRGFCMSVDRVDVLDWTRAPIL